MSEPITWRTLMTNSPVEALTPMTQGAAIFSRGMDRLQREVENQQAVNQGFEDRAEDGRVLAFKEALANAKSPEEVAMLTSQLQGMRGQMGNRGRQAVLGLEDARTATTMDQITKRNTFTDQATDRANLGVTQQIIGLAAQGDPTSRQQALQLIKDNPTLRNGGELTKAIVAGERDLERFNFVKAEEGRKVEMFPLEKEAKRAATAASYAATRSSNASTDVSQFTLKTAKEREEQDKVARAAKANVDRLKNAGNPYAQDGIYTPDRSTEVRKLAVELKLPHDSEEMAYVVDAINRVNKERKDKNELPLPMSEVKQAVLQARDKLFSYNEGPADNVEKYLKNLKFSKMEMRSSPEEGIVAYDPMVDHYQAYLTATGQVADAGAPRTGVKNRISAGSRNAGVIMKDFRDK